MSTIIRPEITMKSAYWIPKHKYYELKHFCLQYDDWVRAKRAILEHYISPSGEIKQNTAVNDPTSVSAIMLDEYDSKINLIKKKAKESDEKLWNYIFDSVTKGYTYEYFQTIHSIPVSRDTFYNRYRKFFGF